jgi:hypothetical protein
MNVRKLLARLNPSSARFEIHHGGAPELTAQDIAGALGMIDDALAREVFCAVWWPDGAQLNRAALDRMLREAQLREWLRLRRELEAAKLALHIAQDDLDGTYSSRASQRQALQQATDQLDAVKARQWPAVGPIYRAVRRAVLAELSTPELCPHCQGRGEVRVGDRLLTCQYCEGHGRAPVSDRKRAAMIERDEAGYRRVWRPVYEWTLALCAGAETRGARALERTLGPAG